MRLLENNCGKVRCTECDSVMDQITKEDIHLNDDGYYIICPVCGSTIWFGDSYTYKRHHIVENALTPGGIPHR